MHNKEFESLYVLSEQCIKGGTQVKTEGCRYIKPGESLQVNFPGSDIGFTGDKSKKYKLRMTGEIDLHPLWRTEGYFPPLYRLIDDSLCSDAAHHSRYCLKIASNGEAYPRRAYFKYVWSDLQSELPEMKQCGDRQLKFGIWCRKENVELLPGGALKFVAEVYFKKADRHIRSISDAPDAIYTIDLGDGSCDWVEKSLFIQKDEEIASILIYVSAEHFTGAVWLEDPFMLLAGLPNLLPQFAPSTPFVRFFDWTGQNLSKKEWPEFEVTINNKMIFKGQLFERIYRWPASEVEIPAGTLEQGRNEVIIKLVSNYRDALPYKLKKIEFTCQTGGTGIVACPEIVTAGREFTILVTVDRPGLKAAVKCSNAGIYPLKNEIVFEKSGLNIVRFNALCAGEGGKITLETQEGSCECIIERIVEREDDKVLTGTSDAVYINSNINDMEHFLSWYMYHQLGNFITFRPVYRGSGTRTADDDVWGDAARLCRDMGIYYANMIECRELPGSGANPERSIMQSGFYLGDQSHERDGFYYYWGAGNLDENEEIFYDIQGIIAKHNDSIIVKTPARTANGQYFNIDPHGASDMKQAAKNFVNGVSLINSYAVRHTGPSVLFRYFYQAGVEWLGAELLYGPHEIIISALRGASRAYKRNSYGAHLAIQWSTTPHDTEQRYRRYMLGLYLCYMNGVDQINTEEGLWRLEERFADFERFSEPCIRHREVQQKFYWFVQTHSRRGSMHVPMAFLHGQYDGWVCFTRRSVWSQAGEEWKFGTPEESWDLLKIFYPRSVLNAIYRHPCPDEPQGFYTGTPYGNVDIVPVEADADVLQSYKIMAFLGWNTAEEWQMEKLVKFVQNGGTLLLGLPHLFSCTKRSDILGQSPEMLDSSYVRELIGAEINGFTDVVLDNGAMAGAGRIILHGARAVVESMDGIPVVIENSLGNGKVIFVNMREYPAHQHVRGLYEEQLKNLGRLVLDAEREKGWLSCSDNVGFNVYDRKFPCNLRTIYFMNINWWDGESMPDRASLLWGDSEIEIEVRREDINIMTLSQNWAVWTFDNETDIISLEELNGASIRVQGKGRVEMVVLVKGCNNKEHMLQAYSGDTDSIQITPHSVENAWKVEFNLNRPAELKLSVICNR